MKTKKILSTIALVILVIIGERLFSTGNDIQTDCPDITTDTLVKLPYTLSHNVVISGFSSGTEYVFNLGGYANDTITSKVVSYNISSNFFDTTLIPPLPQKLANGFGFTLGDSMYYGGGYTQAWTDQTSPVSDTLFDISYPTSSTGFIGTKGRVLRTTNNGTVWSNIFLDTNRNIVSVDFTSGTNGYAVASRDTSIIFRTTNTVGLST